MSVRTGGRLNQFAIAVLISYGVLRVTSIVLDIDLARHVATLVLFAGLSAYWLTRSGLRPAEEQQEKHGDEAVDPTEQVMGDSWPTFQRAATPADRR